MRIRFACGYEHSQTISYKDMGARKPIRGNCPRCQRPEKFKIIERLSDETRPRE